jgi:hypothetical protein
MSKSTAGRLPPSLNKKSFQRSNLLKRHAVPLIDLPVIQIGGIGLAPASQERFV